MLCVHDISWKGTRGRKPARMAKHALFSKKGCLIQVATGTEETVERGFCRQVNHDVYGKCFHPTRVMRKKLRGQWLEISEKLIPGYVFITSDDPNELNQALRDIPALTKLLGHEGDAFTGLRESEEEWLLRLVSPEENRTEVGLSTVEIDENDEVTVLDGPLKGMLGQIKKIDLHRRHAEVEVTFMNRTILLYLGFELIKKA